MNQLLINHIIGFSINAVILTGIALLVFKSNPQSSLHQAFAGNQIAVSWWSFFTIFMIVSSSREGGLFWDRMCLSGVVFIPATLFHYIFSFTKNDKRLSKVIYVNYFISLSFLIILWTTPLFVADVKPKFGMNFFTVPGPLYIAFVAWFVVNVISGLINLWGYIGHSRSLVERRQTQLLFWFSLFGYGGGVCNYLLVYDMHLPGVAETSNYAVLMLSISMAYIIFKYKFLDVKVIIKKTIVFAGIFGMAMIIISLVGLVSEITIKRFGFIDKQLSNLIALGIVILLYEPTKAFLARSTDKYLFQKKTNIAAMLKSLSTKIITVLSSKEIGSMVMETLLHEIRTETGGLLIKREDVNEYYVADSFGMDEEFQTKDSVLFGDYFSRNKHAINLELQTTFQDVPQPIIEWLRKLKVSICMPLHFGGNLKGILFFGKKKSDEMYTHEEIEALSILTNQIAVALNNAEEIEKREKNQIEYSQQSKLAAIGTLSAGISHEIKNPLNNIRGVSSLFQMSLKNKVFSNMDKQGVIEFVDEIFQKVIGHVDRANDVIERLSSFAKKPSEEKIEAINLQEAVDVAAAFLEKQIQMRNIKLTRQYLKDMPLVRADKHAMEDNFFNLLVNATHAMDEGGEISIKTEIRDKSVCVAIKDTGHGISKDKLDKIFDPFFTTKDTSRVADEEAIKGTGLGLYIVRETVRKFGGDIKVESIEKKGTTFTIILPIADIIDTKLQK